MISTRGSASIESIPAIDAAKVSTSMLFRSNLRISINFRPALPL